MLYLGTTFLLFYLLTRMNYLLLLALLFGALLPTSIRAQTPLGQPTLNEQKVQIWCAAARFVYEDTGRPALKQKLNCGGSLKQFENSIQADSQKVYSLLYQPLEGRGVMYKGLGSDKARLQKLTSEIITKLKASPSRKANPARLQAVDALATALTNYVENGTPPGDVSSLTAEPTPDTSTDETTAAAPADAGPEDNPNYATPAPANNTEGVMSSLFAPIAFIMALLSLVLFWLLRRSIKELDVRTGRYRKELEELKASGVSGVAAGSTFSARRLTPEMHAELERLVRQHVAEQLRQQTPDAFAVETAGSGTAPTNTPAAHRPSNDYLVAQGVDSQTTASTAPAPFTTSAAAMPEEAARPAPAAAAAPATYLSSPASPLESPLPAGPPSASPRDEFDNLVPPVQLPAPESYTSVAAPSPSIRYVYAQAPVDGAFQEIGFHDEPQYDSVYEITLNASQPDTASFQVNADPSVHAYAIQNAQNFLATACHYPQSDEPAYYIINDEPGVLRYNSGVWQIERQATVHFE